MREDLRPYWVKRTVLRFSHWYVEYFLRPEFAQLGAFHHFINPWHTIVSGANIRLGVNATVVADADNKVRIGVWGREQGQGQIDIGDNVLISPGTRISASDRIVIGDGSMIANGVYITDCDWHGIYDRVSRDSEPKPVELATNVWLGDRCTVLKGVHIGENSVVAASSVVTKAVPANVVVAGNPAKVVKTLDPAQALTTRNDYFSDPAQMKQHFDDIDRIVLQKNALLRWLASLVYPAKFR